MSALGNLVVALSLEYATYTKGLDKSDQETLRFAKNTQNAMDKMERSVQSYIGKVAGIGAAYLSVTSVFDSFNKQVDALAQLDDAAQKTGASVELLSKIQQTAKAFGVDFAEIDKNITKLAKGIAGLDDPTNKTNAAMKALGINVRDANGNLRDAAALYIEASQRLQNFRDDSSKTGLAIDAIGKAGAENLPFLNDLAANVDKFSGVSAEAAANGAALQDSINAQKQKFDQFTQQLTIDVLPAVTDLAGAFLDIQENGSKLANDKSVANWADTIALGLAPAYDTVVNLKNELVSIGKSFQVVYADLAQASARMKTLNPAAYLTGDPLKNLADAEAYRERVLKEADASWQQTISRPRDEYEKAVQARMAARPSNYASPSVAGSNANKPSVGYVSGQDAKDAANAKKLQSDLEAAKKAYDSLISSIEKQIEVKRAEYSINGPLSESEKTLLDINAKRTDGVLVLTDAEYKNAKSKLSILDAETRNAEMFTIRTKAEQDYLTIVEQTTAARDQVYTDLQDETTALEELSQAKLDEIEQLNMTREQLDALGVARYNEKIGVLETQLAYLQSQPDRENEIELIKRQIEALEILRGSVGKAEAITKSKAETADMFGSMEQAARVVWTVFANSGEDAAKAAGRAIKASILDLLYQMTIKKFFINVSASISAPAAVSGALIDPSATSNTSVIERISNVFKNSNIGITDSIEKLGAIISNGNGGLLDGIGGFMSKYSSQIADGIGYLGAAYMATQGNIPGAVLTAVGTYFGGPIGGAIGGAIGSLFGGKVSTKKYSTGVTGNYSNGQFTSSNQSGLAGYGRALGGNEGLASILKNYSTVISGLFDAFDMGGDVNTSASLFQRSGKKTRAWGYFGAQAGGGSVNFSSGDTAFGNAQDAMNALVEKILTEGIASLVATSNLPEGIRMLFDGLGNKETVQAMVAASINLGNAQDALLDRFNLSADAAGKVAKASGYAGEQLAAFVNSLTTVSLETQKSSVALLKERASLLQDIGVLPASLKDFDAYLKNINTTTLEGQQKFAEIFGKRDQFANLTSAWDAVNNNLSSSLYGLLTPSQQFFKDSEALEAMFKELGISVPQTNADLQALGDEALAAIKAGNPSEQMLDLALAFPTLAQAFTDLKDKADAATDSLKGMPQFTNLADYRFYTGVAKNYGKQYANDYTGINKLLGSNAQGQTTLNGESIGDLKKLLADLQDTTKQALVVQRGTQAALEQIQARGLKTI